MCTTTTNAYECTHTYHVGTALCKWRLNDPGDLTPERLQELCARESRNIRITKWKLECDRCRVLKDEVEEMERIRGVAWGNAKGKGADKGA
jgi:hypothetical protein